MKDAPERSDGTGASGGMLSIAWKKKKKLLKFAV